MVFTIDKVHSNVLDEATGRMVLVGTNPYSRWVKSGEAPINVQKGRFYSDGGDRIPTDDVPSWVWDQVKNMTEEGRRAVGIDLSATPIKKKKAKKAPEEVTPEIGAASDGDNPLYDVLASLRNDDDTHWTKAGLPDLNVVKEKLGYYVSRKTLTDKHPEIVRRAQEE